MNPLFSTLPPNEAWQPLDATKTEWTTADAAHLFRRAGFAATTAQLNRAKVQTPQEIIDELLAEDSELESEFQAIQRTVVAGRDPKQLPALWLYRMMRSPAQLLEKLTLFWHGHFATSAEKVADVNAMLAQNRLLKRYAVGSFRELVLGVSRDPAMLVYLDSTDNRKTHPNENYARELLELFCLGLDNYTERDIQELARCFTGWEVRRGKFRFNRYQHDRGTKSLFGYEGEFGGEEAVDLVLQQPACARFIVLNLLQFFVADEVDWPDDYVQPLIDRLKEDDFHVLGVVKMILSSRLMYSPRVRGLKIRSPLELALGVLRSFGATTDLNRLVERLRSMGQVPFYPPNVKGWDGGRKWINTSTMLARANLVDSLLFDEQTKWRSGNLANWLQERSVEDSAEAVSQLVNFLFAVKPSSDKLERISMAADESNLDDHQDVARIVHTLAVLPEFQLS